MNYTIIQCNNTITYPCNMVLFEDGTKQYLAKDKNGEYVFNVQNTINDNKSFFGAIKDAIESIRNGEGDILGSDVMFANIESVYRYLDRNYGEKMRMKTIENFKNVIFGYSIRVYNKFDSCIRSLSSNNEIIPLDQPNYIYFDNYDDAEKFKNDIIEQVYVLNNDFKKAKDDLRLFITLKSKAKKQGIMHIINYMHTALINNDLYELKVVQAIKL